ncbi:putative PEP-CTERM system histidine kinase [Rhizomicrobium palustre]|uniref:histidine kinase n=1 Tax=Rhizomicrobium palustre TaxID=189966 RepID=A0A846MU09_9PROT|nr:XrtA/PEP-CTERM system histidine kinase PrsK [Rhizomicrobium palustre]NIK86715.1 putative PEP-CTERM system histidine kinase [Rhizomicrobium palustre]
MGQGLSLFAGFLTGLGFAGFSVALPVWGKRTWPNAFLSIAAAATSLWAITILLVGADIANPAIARTAASLREGCWIALTIALLRQDAPQHSLWRRLAVCAALLVGFDIFLTVRDGTIDTGLGLRLSPPLTHFAVAVMGLILTENLYRNASRSRLWSVKLLIAGLASLYGYHIVREIPPLLGGEMIVPFALAEPLLYLVCLPLFVVTAVRSQSLRLKVHSSRRVVFHSATLIVAGIILQGTAAAALYVRHFGGTPATVLAIVLGFSSLVALIVALSAETVRSQIRTFINENFYSYKYDYRQEWMKFNQSLTRYEDRGGPERALFALSDLLDSPGGAIFVRRQGWKQFARLAYSTFGENLGPIQESDPLLATMTDPGCAFIEASTQSVWLTRFPEAWLVVPLFHQNTLIAFCLLGKPRAAKRLDWEDRSLVGLIASQLAAALVHEQTALALADSQQLAEFNNRVSFALHDLKNTAGQLNLLVQNAEKFGDDAAFRSDMMDTIRHAGDNLQKLIGKLRDGDTPRPAKTKSSVILNEVLSRCARKRPGVVVAEESPQALALSQPSTFESALDHVIANATEASPEPGSVSLSLVSREGRLCVCVRDQGPGMSEEFLARELFRPLRTTKKKGLGIGAYQARALMRELGGDIEVESIVGQGTSVWLILPQAQDAETLS